MEYVSQISAGELISRSFTIYFKNFGKLFPIYFVLMGPIGALIALAEISSDATVVSVAYGIVALAGILVTAAFTVAISDICLGNPTGISRAYGRAFHGMFGKLFGTYLLIVILLIIGYVLLIIPGIILSVILIVVMPVVVLERRGGFSALKRAISLGKGKHWRNFGVLLVVGIVAGLFNAIVTTGLGFAAGDSMPYLMTEPGFAQWLALFIIVELGILLAPTQIVYPVLLYYDLRSRKEAYNVASLRDDLMR